MASDILALAREVLANYSLHDSALSRNADVKVQQGGQSVVVELLLDNYIEFVENGRKPFSGKKPPIDALRDWALTRNIPADNSTLWAISTAIQRDGYEGRPILATLEQRIESCIENEWADKLLDHLVGELAQYFE